MKRVVLICIMLLCYCNVAMAQNYHNINHSSGTQFIANVSVKVDVVGNAGIYPGTSCGIGSYQIGAGPASPVTSSGFTYTFGRAVKEVRCRITASEPGEVISVKINGKNYTLTTANLGTFTAFCGSTTGSALNTNGQVYFTSGSSNVNTELRMIDSIKSITILDIDTIGGSVMQVDFVTDTVVEVLNYVDTILCVGDTVDIPYRIAGYFAAGNQFIFQLSNQFGSFASPTILATVNGTNSGTCRAVIPFVPVSDAYRIRVVATSPSYISKPFPVNIAIGQPPVGIIYNTGPACAGGFAQIGYTHLSHFTEVRWSRYGGPVFSKLQHHAFKTVHMTDSGLYYAEMQDYGCVISDTTRLKVKPNPLIADIRFNNPLCEGDTLQMSGNIDTVGVSNVWVKPDGNTDTIKALTVLNVSAKDSGKYILVTRLDGCVAFDSVLVNVKHMPVTELEDTSICFGETLMLRPKDTMQGVVYQWNGPSGFVANAKDITISPAYFGAKGMYVLKASLDGCVRTDTMIADIRPLPLTPVALKDTALCSGGSLMLGIKEKNQHTTYSWIGPSGFTSIVADTVLHSVQVDAGGKYILYADLDNCKTSDTIDVLVKRSPIKPIASVNSPVMKGGVVDFKIENKENGINYVWRGPSGFSSQLISPDINNAQPWHSGRYVLVAELEGCMDSTDIWVNIGDVADTGFIVLYPNANDGNFYLKGLLYNNQQAEISIFNDAGQMVYLTTVPVADKLLYTNINMKGALSGGVYMLKLKADGKLRVFKFVVVRR